MSACFCLLAPLKKMSDPNENHGFHMDVRFLFFAHPPKKQEQTSAQKFVFEQTSVQKFVLCPYLRGRY